MDEACTHLGEIREVTASGRGCEECLRLGDRWVHLRICLICGHVGCCDESKNKHATKHFHATKHPIIQSFQPGEEWLWCYVDEVYWDEPPVPVKIHRAIKAK
ncbi:MAG: ubiquitin carboxyl-terminal hydrolase 14 [Chloroflexota bacterium]